MGRELCVNQFSNLINQRIEAMRRKLQDTSRRNPLINNVLSAKSASYIRIVDEKPQSIFDHLIIHERKMTLAPLPPIDIDPPDEETKEFKNALLNAQSTDESYLKTIEDIDFEYDEKALDKQENEDRALKDKVREALEMPPRPKSEHFSDLINHAKSHRINPASSLPLPSAKSDDDRFDDNELQTLLLPKTFQSRLARILSKARMYQEERGLNVVYIGLGYLKWTLPNAEKLDEFKSPILLLPVSLTKHRSSAGENYSITKLSDPLLNPSLEHKLTAEAKLDISQVKALFDTDNIDIEKLFEAIADIKPKNMRWTVQREATFGIFPFQGIELYYDLDTEKTDFSKFPIVSELMIGKGPESTSYSSDFSEEDVDSLAGRKLVPHIVLDADSSQFISLMKVANNDNVALEGPPGSGKSQTIVNAIANAIFSGKKVLFVAQKVTALEVVLSRLQSLGLHQFVLPLMGGHGNTKNFYDAVKNRLETNPSQETKDIENLKLQLQSHREKLADYIDVLTSSVSGTGMSVHQVLGLAIANSDFIKELPHELRSLRIHPDRMVRDLSPSDLDTMSSQVADWHERLESAGISEDSPWANAPEKTLDTDLVNKALVESSRAITEIQSTVARLDENSKKLVQDCLTNPYHFIDEILELTKDENVIFTHDLCANVGKPEAGNALLNLVEANTELAALEKQLKLSSRQLTEVSKSKDKLKKLKQVAVEFKSNLIESGTIDSVETELSILKTSLQKLMEIKSELFNQISPNLTAQQILAYQTILKDQDEIKSFKSYLQEVGLNSCRHELRKARQLLRIKSQIFSGKSLPSAQELSTLQNTIENAGIFSFLSSAPKAAKKEVVQRLVLARETDAKTILVKKLDEAQSFIKDWTRLELSNQVDIADDRLSDQLLRLITTLDELETINSRTGLNDFSTLKLLTHDKLKEIIELLCTSEASDLSWYEIESKAFNTEKKINSIKSQLDDLKSAEILLIELGKSSISDVNALHYHADIINGLLVKRESSLELLSSDFQSVEIAETVLDAYEIYNQLTENEINILFKQEGERALMAIEGLLEAFATCKDSFANLMSAKNKRVVARNISLKNILEDLENHHADKKGLNSLLARRSVFAEAEKAGLDDLVNKLDEFEHKRDIEPIAKAALAATLQDQIEYDFGAKLMQFDGTSLNAARKKIQELDRKIIEISRHEVTNKAIVSAEPPNGNAYGNKSDYTELALLSHELQKKRRTSPRKVLKRARKSLLELFPCWMMVPSAVAQNLPKSADFDLVIIDEASQMTPENSISALMRAKNAFIAGDTNQLPPTNFFKGLSGDGAEDEDVTTMEESILELANIQFHPKHRLLWHYRSKHEDLIAFSNHYVYDNELVIFPSPNPTTPGLGVTLVEVNGTFQRGINPAEAQVMVEAIVQFMRDNPNRSLGVAVMNQSQMEHIEALILREADTDKIVSNYLDKWTNERQGLERFFVKNLENVQGDERDVIFIGTVYGRDLQGKFYQRFGPINGPAGKRRLNVLFSRAKEQIITFSSIPLGEFNPSPTNEGATLLRRWLEFSATKRLGEVAHNHDRAGHTDSPFEDHVIEAVTSLGYEAVPQVGVSSYFIDIGIKHSKYPFGYICGIECDGATYHSSKSARDRDRLREEVLNRLGWDLYRIWSTDWFRDPLGCREVMKTYLAERLDFLLENTPKIVQPNSVKPDRIELDSRQISPKIGVNTLPNGSTAVVNVTPHIEAASKSPTRPQQNEDVSIKIGTKLSIRYLNGPRAGVVAKFWFQKTTNDKKFEVNGYKSLGTDSPLGEALEEAQMDDIVTFTLKKQDIRVQVIEIIDTSQSI
jgi:superfamily I DNA and/or RNA helicase/very-short-patch-repair endonuclease